MFSVTTSKGKTLWTMAIIAVGRVSGKAYGHVPLTNEDGTDVVYSSKALALAFKDGYTYRDNELFEDEQQSVAQ